MTTDVVLAVESLETVFRVAGGVVRAVRGVSFDVRRGERLAIVGESGSGKSALALSILRLVDPPGHVVGGHVRLGDRDLGSLTEREMEAVRGKAISYISQDPMSALDPVKTIGSHLVETIRLHDEAASRRTARRRAIELLREVEVRDAERRLDDYPHQYSGGMRQRVMIASALAHEPDVVIADEPTTALDVTTQAHVLRLLNRLVSERGTAVMLITHNLGIVAEFCDSVRVMYAGRLVESADTRSLFRRPAHPYSEALLRSVPRPDRLEHGPLPAIPGAPPNLAALPDGCSFQPRCPLTAGRALCTRVDPAPNAVEGGRFAECHFVDEQLARSELNVRVS